MPRHRDAFTLIELLIVIAIIAFLIGIVLPSLGAARLTARATACGVKLQQLGVSLNLYLNDFDNRLPQALGPVAPGVDSVIGALFGGKKGVLPFYGISTIGAERRPLNRYVAGAEGASDTNGGEFELLAYRSPVDKGVGATGIPFPPYNTAASMYDFIGSSYTLNDHSLEGETFATLVPMTARGPGGKMPLIRDTSKTWVLGTHTIYNYQLDNGAPNDKRMRWFGEAKVEANLLFADFHVRSRVRVPQFAEDGVSPANTTADYTFLP
jgi:prepilin-type N-terminal cleavage/methylation domain-containing protein/prepilin-type processing-associated H-X9-DG protein